MSNITKYVTKRNVINVLGAVAAILGIALQMEIIEGPDAIKWASFAIAVIGYFTNDNVKEIKESNK